MYPLDRHRSQFRRLGVIDELIEREIIRSLLSSYNFQEHIMEFMKEGIVVVSTQLNIIYLNYKAKQIHKILTESLDCSERFMAAISDLSRQFRDVPEQKISIVDCQLMLGMKIRIRACRLPDRCKDASEETASDCPYLLIFLEDRSASLQEDLKIEQQKYQLTEREVEIWQLLLKAYSYQEIAKVLQISLNTVKFHAKNVYAKRRCYLETAQATCLDRQAR